jgi:hypothetical protein
MGYPGKPTDDVMDLVRQVRELSWEAGNYDGEESETGEGCKLCELEEKLDALMDEIHSLVHGMDTSEDDYARDNM